MYKTPVVIVSASWGCELTYAKFYKRTRHRASPVQVFVLLFYHLISRNNQGAVTYLTGKKLTREQRTKHMKQKFRLR